MNVLVADDDAISRKLQGALLASWGYEPVMAQNGDEAWELLRADGAPQLVLLDWMMPGKDGMAIVRMLRQLPRQEYTYVLMLTAKTKKADVQGALYAGCDDYLTKPFDAEELRARLFVGQRTLLLHNELAAAYDRTAYQATHDALTGILNRAAILQALAKELARAKRSHDPLSVLMIDIDRFKLVNDLHGHAIGDAVLVEVAGRIERSLRTYDLVGRYGGEEFLVIAPCCGAQDATSTAYRLRSVVGSSPVAADGVNVDVTVSIGVADLINDADNPAAIVLRADQAMYAAKLAGRNRVEVFREQEPEPANPTGPVVRVEAWPISRFDRAGS